MLILYCKRETTSRITRVEGLDEDGSIKLARRSEKHIAMFTPQQPSEYEKVKQYQHPPGPAFYKQIQCNEVSYFEMGSNGRYMKLGMTEDQVKAALKEKGGAG